jgi:hypothetical protein
MTKEDIMRLAEASGVEDSLLYEHWRCNLESMTRFAALVASAEREACAKLAMTISEQGLPEEMPEGDELLQACRQIANGVLIADAIRARGQA